MPKYTSNISPENPGEFLLYESEDGQTRIEVRLEEETVWLSQRQMAELFQTSISNINKHLKAVYDEGEITSEATIEKYSIVQTEGNREVSRQFDHYNLDAIISVGYRVRSPRGTQFRMWATERLREYLIKGFAMDDERLKRAGGGNYFEELLARIRDIRSSERVFWSYDFVHCRRHDGRAFRLLNLMDEHTLESLSIDVERKLNSEHVLERLSDLFVRRGVPDHIRSDNGPEFTAERIA